MMKIFNLTLFLTIIGLTISCTKHSDELSDEESNSKPDFEVALKFINDYSEFCNPENKTSITTSDWINSNKLITENFKSTYNSLIDSANKNDPELGLDFDPIFDAQDFPEKGFKISTIDNNSGYLTVSGIDMPEFKLTMRITRKNKNWLVDGVGIINIPENKKASR